MQFGSHIPTSERARSYATPLLPDGTQWKFAFPNGFGASVISDGYGSDRGLYELAVLGPDGHLTYNTPITDDVLGYLTESDVAEHLDAIAALPVEVSA